MAGQASTDRSENLERRETRVSTEKWQLHGHPWIQGVIPYSDSYMINVSSLRLGGEKQRATYGFHHGWRLQAKASVSIQD